MCHTVWHLIQSSWRRAVALGRVVPPRRAIAASSAPEGEKVRNVCPGSSFCSQSLRDTVIDPKLVIEHDYGLKNRC